MSNNIPNWILDWLSRPKPGLGMFGLAAVQVCLQSLFFMGDSNALEEWPFLLVYAVAFSIYLSSHGKLFPRIWIQPVLIVICLILIISVAYSDLFAGDSTERNVLWFFLIQVVLAFLSWAGAATLSGELLSRLSLAFKFVGAIIIVPLIILMTLPVIMFMALSIAAVLLMRTGPGWGKR